MLSKKRCPCCGKLTATVYRSKVVAAGRVRNLRCRNCGKSWRTVEMGVETLRLALGGSMDEAVKVWRLLGKEAVE